MVMMQILLVAPVDGFSILICVSNKILLFKTLKNVKHIIKYKNIIALME